MTFSLETTIIKPEQDNKIKNAIILLHGYGGDVKDMLPKDLRLSIANEFANEYKAEIEIQGGEMV